MADVNYSLYPHGLPTDTIRLFNGMHIHYRTSEAGQIPVVFLHGYGLSSLIWEKVQILLSSRYRSFAPDLRGFGLSDKPEEGYGYEELVEDLLQFLRVLKIRQAVFVGHAFGGSLLQHFASRHPDRVMALVLVNSAAACLAPPGVDAKVWGRLDGYGTPEANRAILRETLPSYFDAANVTGEDLEHFVETASQAGSAALRKTLETLYAASALPREGYDAMRMPTLIAVGTHDPFGAFGQAVALSDVIGKSKVAVLARCGHSPMWEKPIEFVKVVTEFLNDSGLK
jgi:pimeloyl-ACP methyl ester carboxylesterase